MEEEDKKILEQLENNYKNAIIHIVENNTKTLIDEDIASLIKEPPLDSMDLIKQKLLYLAKREKIVLNDENLKKLLSNYRMKLLEKLSDLKEIRNKPLIDRIVDFTPERETETIDLEIEDLTSIGKKIKSRVKKSILECNDKVLVEDIATIYKDTEDKEKTDNISQSFLKYMKTTYHKQLLESIAIKIMVKDRTLINGINEQGERYLFTKTNSHIFNEKKLSA